MKTRLVGFLYSTSLPRAGIFHASRLLRTKGRMRRTSREIFTHAIPAARKFPVPARPLHFAPRRRG